MAEQEKQSTTADETDGNDNGPPEESVEKYLEAVNAASSQARGMWLGFLGLVTYLFVAIAGVTHTDLLLNSPVKLPIVNVEIPLFSFFIAAPALFVLVHLGLLVQHAMLSQKIQRFLVELNDGVLWGPGPHEMRSRVHAYTQTQLLAGPRRSAVLAVFLHIMSWVTIYALPILLLLGFQLTFLPYHAEWVTLGHAAALAIDLLIVILIGVFIARPSDSFGRSFAQILTTNKLRSLGVALVTPAVLYLSIFVLTVPDRDLDAYRQRPDERIAWAFAPANWLTYLMFTDDFDKVTGKPSPVWKFSRNLIVTDKDLVPDEKSDSNETSLSLRGRDLRFARLDRSDLHRADLTGSDLRGANFVQAKLQGANFVQAKLQGADLFKAELQGADLQLANLQGANLFLAKLQGADLRRAKLQGANLGSADLRGADLREALIWQTGSPSNLRLADMTGLKIAPLLDGEADKAWSESEDHQAWIGLSGRPGPPPAELSDFLTELACGDNTDGYISMGAARRGFESHFSGDRRSLARGLTGKSCLGAGKLDDATISSLCLFAGWPAEDLKETVCAP